MNRDGYILVAVLTTMLVLAGLVSSASLVAQSALRSARAEDGTARLDGLLRGGLELAAFQVFTLKQPFAAVNGRPIRLTGGTAVPTFTDEAARIDINAADPKLIVAALETAGIDKAEAAALVDRLSAMRGGTAPAALPTPPDANGMAAMPGRPAATQGPHTDFPSVADFAAFARLDQATAARLPAVLTVDNPDGLVDVMTASRAVLMVLPEMSDAMVETILRDRAGGPSTAGSLKAALKSQAAFVKFEPGPCYGIDVTASDSAGHTGRRHGVVAASRSPDVPFYTLAWEPAP